MARVSDSIPNLINGISQQPAAVRLPSQAVYQENCYSSVVKGLGKRPPTEHVAKLMDTMPASAFVHLINRDASERYVVVIGDNGDLKVFDFDGTEKTVNMETGAGDYLDASDPESEYKAVTVADYTFIINKAKTVAKTSDKSPSQNPQALAHVISGNYGRTYRLKINGTEVAYYKGPDGSNAEQSVWIDTNFIRDVLYAEALGNTPPSFSSTSESGGSGLPAGNWTVTKIPQGLHIENDDGTDFEIEVEDGQNGNAFVAIKDVAQNFEDLPYEGHNSFHVKLQGDDISQFSAYYVQWDGSAWAESIAEDIDIRIDKTTMPHQLVRQSDGTFSFGPVDWVDREVGDDNTNPFPSFIGKNINEVIFHRNRLGIFADENVAMSAAGDFFRFFRTTATALLDDDPIDVAASHTKVSILQHGVPYQEQLLLFSDQTQFKFQGNQLLTPKTASILPTTEFESSKLAAPVATGSFVFFAVEKSGYASIREYFVDLDAQTNDANDVTGHVPEYIEAGIDMMAASSNEDAVLVHTRTESGRLYVYKFFTDGEKRLQSSWSHWTFPGVANVLGFTFVQSDLYLAVARSDGLYFEKMAFDQGSVPDGNLGFRLHLDRKFSQANVSMSYDSADDQTTITLPYTFDDGTPPTLVTDAGSNGIEPGYVIPAVSTDGENSEIVVSGDATSWNFFGGITFKSRYELSTIYVRRQAQDGSSVITEGRLQLQTVAFQYSETGYFEVNVTPQGRSTYTYIFNGRQIGDSDNKIGEPAIDTGAFRVPVYTRNDRAKIEITSESHLPFFLQNVEWTGQFYIKSQRL